MNGQWVADEMAEHELLAVDVQRAMCSCGARPARFIEHLADVACSLMDITKPVPRRTPEPMAAYLVRTRALLADLAARQERLGAELEATGLTSFTDRADWLIAHRTADEQLAWRLHWLSLGITDPEPQSEQFARPASLEVARRRRTARDVIPRDRQLDIALNVYDTLPTEVRARWREARAPRKVPDTDVRSAS